MTSINLFTHSLRASSLRYRPLVPIVSSAHFWQTRRTVASSVSNRPASQSLPQAKLNIKEESRNAAKEVQKIIAGSGAGQGGFIDETRSVASEVPKPAMVLGLSGAIPYVGASATTVYLAHQASLAASGANIGIDPGVALTVFDQALNVQVTYGAVMLSFLGALHWGMEFAGYGGHHGYKRLLLGAAPVMFAWPTLALQPTTALITQWIGFTSLWAADSKVTSMGWTPKWYSQYRFYLSILVGTCIIGSLAGTSYYGPVAGHGFVTHDLDEIRAERSALKQKSSHLSTPMREGEASISAKAGDGASPAFVKLEKQEQEKEKEAKK